LVSEWVSSGYIANFPFLEGDCERSGVGAVIGAGFGCAGAEGGTAAARNGADGDSCVRD